MKIVEISEKEWAQVLLGIEKEPRALSKSFHYAGEKGCGLVSYLSGLDKPWRVIMTLVKDGKVVHISRSYARISSVAMALLKNLGSYKKCSAREYAEFRRELEAQKASKEY